MNKREAKCRRQLRTYYGLALRKTRRRLYPADYGGLYDLVDDQSGMSLIGDGPLMDIDDLENWLRVRRLAPRVKIRDEDEPEGMQ